MTIYLIYLSVVTWQTPQGSHEIHLIFRDVFLGERDVKHFLVVDGAMAIASFETKRDSFMGCLRAKKLVA